eukprot:COSAG06_NODE_164_length_21596_cov_37.740500_20_plen_627_part_00
MRPQVGEQDKPLASLRGAEMAAHEPEDASGPAAALREDVAQQMARIYEVHRPEKAAQLAELLDEWRGEESLLLAQIKVKYGVPTASFEKGLELYSSQKPREAIRAFRLALDHADLRVPRAYTGIGLCQHAQGAYQEALESFDLAIEVRPAYGNAWYNRWKVLSHFADRAAEADAARAKAKEFGAWPAADAKAEAEAKAAHEHAAAEEQVTNGRLAVRVMAAVCRGERDSAPWQRFMDRVLSRPDISLPYCELSLAMSSAESEPQLVCRRTASATLSRPEPSPSSSEEPNSNPTATDDPFLCWGDGAGEEVEFVGVFGSSKRRMVRLEVHSIGAAEVDLHAAPHSCTKSWSVGHWVDLVDRHSMCAASVQVQIRWVPSRDKEKERLERERIAAEEAAAAGRLAAEEEAARVAAEEEAARVAAEEEAVRLLAEEEAAQAAAAEAEAARLAAEAAEVERGLAEEEAVRAAAAAEAERIAAEEAATRLIAAEEVAKVLAEEEARRAAEEAAHLEAEAAARVAAEDAARVAAEEEAARLAAEEAARIAAEEEVARLAAEEETARLAAEEASQLAAEQAARLAAQEEAIRAAAAAEAAVREQEWLNTACPHCEPRGLGELCQKHANASARYV